MERAGGCFLKRCGDFVVVVVLSVYKLAHTHKRRHNGFTPDTRRGESADEESQPVFVIRGLDGASRAARRQQRRRLQQ